MGLAELEERWSGGGPWEETLGSQSDHGERTIERLLSASVTCRRQGRSLFAYLTDVLNATIRGDPIPLLAWSRGDRNADQKAKRPRFAGPSE